MAARRVHTPEAGGSNPPPATRKHHEHKPHHLNRDKTEFGQRRHTVLSSHGKRPGSAATRGDEWIRFAVLFLPHAFWPSSPRLFVASGHKEHPGGTTNGVSHPSLAAASAEARISARNPGFVFFDSRNPSAVGRSVSPAVRLLFNNSDAVDLSATPAPRGKHPWFDSRDAYHIVIAPLV